MTAFFAHIFFRALSGASNAAFYADRRVAGIAACWLFSVACFCAPLFHLPGIALAVFAFSSLAVLGKMRAFAGQKTFGTADIHLWENLTTAGIPLAIILSGGSIVLTALGLYPGLFLHKMLINFGSGIPVFDNRTDDATGKTYGMALPVWLPVFGGETVAVPRTTQKTRLIVAVGCIAAAVAFRFSPFYPVPVWGIFINLLL